ncbi:MAG TPA: S46 family peptidase [Candidatus Polarisedimenticolaceae bacterium]|nr:S46 family peptidase [Candidatus Polarisedimenticolaceae bacterium]
MNDGIRTLLASTAIAVAVSCPAARAAEGMWTPAQMTEVGGRLAAAGLELPAATLSDLTAHPMNAVISLGGCTASFVSADGLVVTNHHCATRAIQHNSTEERNLLETGFLAGSRDEELFAGPGSRLLVTVAADDVTDRILAELDAGLDGYARQQEIEAREKRLVADCEKDPGHRCRVASFHGGLQYVRIKQLEIRDVRLVYAPADGVGNYGGEIDNWMWPRHTGDFSFYRAYVDRDGKAADHAPTNVPYRPKHHLTIAGGGLGTGDFVIVAGYPGRTNRYRLADEVHGAFEWYYPRRRAALEQWLAVIERETAARPDARIRYAGRVSGLNNSIKNYQGMLDSYAKVDLVGRKRKLESELAGWIGEDAERAARCGDALGELQRLVDLEQADRQRELYYASLAREADLYDAARTLYRLSRERRKADSDREAGYQQRDERRIRERLTRLERTFDAEVDRAVWRAMLLDYAALPPDQRVGAFDAWFGFDGEAADPDLLDRRLDEMYGATRLGRTETRLQWMDADAPAFDESEDPFIRLAAATYPSDIELERKEKELAGRFTVARPRYMECLIAYRESLGQPVYPDANGTLRLTFGQVRGYSPRDAVVFEPFTTVGGIVEKETGNDPFDAPPPLLRAIAERRFGPYLDPRLGSVPVDFLSDVDTTGGNSGSPTLNARGELVGLLFDGTYESIISDWDFLPEVTRSIHVDIRYALWVMEFVDGARSLVREMSADGGPSTGN